MPETPSFKLRDPLDPPKCVTPCELAYAELDVSSNFSFLRGASHPDELVYTAALLGYRAISITDVCTLAGTVRAHAAAKQCGMKLLVGTRLKFADGTPDVLVWCMNRTGYANLCKLLTRGKRRTEKGKCELYCGDLIEHNEGLLAAIAPGGESDGPSQHSGSGMGGGQEGNDETRSQKSESSSKSETRNEAVSDFSADQGSFAPSGLVDQIASTEDLRPGQSSYAPSGLGPNTCRGHPETSGFDPSDLTRISGFGFRTSSTDGPIDHLRRVFDGRLWLAVSRSYGPDDETELQRVIELSRAWRIPLVATNHVHYHDPARRPLQDVLVCVREKCTIDQAGYHLFPNAERYLKTPAQMHRLFAEWPKAVAATVEIANRCTFSMDELKYEYPDELAPPGKTVTEYLRELTWAGAAERYGGEESDEATERRSDEGECGSDGGTGRQSDEGKRKTSHARSSPYVATSLRRSVASPSIPPKTRQLIAYELDLIEKLKFEAYFLTVHDLVKFARSRGILCQGRGSAANSAVCYCLGVTSVDPSKIDLLFERFISAERGEPPDIDIDFEHERREEVIQYLYKKYGRDRAGLAAEVITYRGRSAIRDVGKALGLSLDMVDQMARKLDWWHRGVLNEAMVRETGLDPNDPNVRRVLALATELLGFPRHLGQHVGGMVMTRGLLCEVVPIENAAMDDRTVVEWDKDDLEELGLLKVDVLGLGMLSCISRAFKLIERSDGATKRRSDEGSECKEGKSARFVLLALQTSDQALQHAINFLQQVGHLVVGWNHFQFPGDFQLRHQLGHGAPGSAKELQKIGPALACMTFGDVRRDRHAGATHLVGQPKLLFFGHMGRQDVHELAEFLTLLPGDQITKRAYDSHGYFRLCHVPFSYRTLSAPLCSSSDFCISLRCSVAPSLRRSSAPLALHTIPQDDPAVYDMICDADTIGVFQIESRAQMSMLPRLRPRTFYDLVIEVAIVRPGPIQGNMVHPYLRRRNGEEAVSYPSEALKQVLGKTLGVPLFQEQAMRVAMVAAGFSAAEADQLRRAMAAWRKSARLLHFQDRIINGMLKNGYTQDFAERTFEQIKGFGEYGFPESHSASFALLVYVSAWLKRYHPAAFAAALINSQPMGFYQPAQIIRDAREHGVRVRGVDVNSSGWDCSLESDEATERRSDEGERESDDGRWDTPPPCTQGGGWGEGRSRGVQSKAHGPPPCPLPPPGGPGSGMKRLYSPSQSTGTGRDDASPSSHSPPPGPAIRLGLRMIKGLREADAHTIAAAKERLRGFTSVEQFQHATRLKKSVLRKLAEADAFASLGLSRREALWQVMALSDAPTPLYDTDQLAIGNRQSAILPQMPLGQEVMTDYATTGLTLRKHPVALVRDTLREDEILTAEEMLRLPHGKWVRVCGLVLIRQRPGTASGIVFITLEDETGVVNLIVRPQIYDVYRPAARHAALLQCDGPIERQGKVVHVMARRLIDRSDLVRGMEFSSRDFH